MLSYDDELQRAQARYLAKVGQDAEVFALIGQGYRRSVYKCFTRRTPKSRWWVFDSGAGRPVSENPIAAHARMVERGGHGVVRAIHVRLADLNDYTFHPDRMSLAALFDRAKELTR